MGKCCSTHEEPIGTAVPLLHPIRADFPADEATRLSRSFGEGRRGYGIALLALAPVVSMIAFEIYLGVQPPNHGPGLGPAQLVMIYFVCACSYALTLLISAVVEAGRARHWRWVAGLIAAAVAHPPALGRGRLGSVHQEAATPSRFR